MSSKQFAAVLGFAFVAIWITLNFGWAVLCLIGALVFYVAAVLIEQAMHSTDVFAIVRRWGSTQTPPAPPPPRPGVR
jgi:hypothetical protein